jgi:transposase
LNRFKQWCAVAARYEKRPANYQAMVVIAALMVWLMPRATRGRL